MNCIRHKSFSNGKYSSIHFHINWNPNRTKHYAIPFPNQFRANYTLYRRATSPQYNEFTSQKVIDYRSISHLMERLFLQSIFSRAIARTLVSILLHPHSINSFAYDVHTITWLLFFFIARLQSQFAHCKWAGLLLAWNIQKKPVD